MTGLQTPEGSIPRASFDMARAIDYLPDATFVIERSGKLIAWNRAAEDMTGVKAADLLGRGNYEYAVPFYGYRRPILIDLVLASEDDIKKGDYVEIKRAGMVLSVEARNPILKGKPSILRASAAPVYDERGEVVGAIESITDITDVKHTESALATANKKLSILNSITRHDILNQISAIRGFLDIYQREVRGDTKLEGYFSRLNGLAKVIEHQISFTKFYQNIGVKSPAWMSVEDIAATASKGFTGITFTADVGSLEIFADPLFEKVFFNLFENSLRHGGRVTEIRVRRTVSGKDCIIVVEDNGIGIAEKDKERIFARGVGKNTGLGLFLVREILAITSTAISETGEPGKGARFEIRVPEGFYRFNETTVNTPVGYH